MIDNEFLILHGVRKSDFLKTQVFSDITALTAFKRNANGVNGVPCRYRGVKGVLLVGINALTAFACKLTALAALTPQYRKNSGVFSKKFDPGNTMFSKICNQIDRLQTLYSEIRRFCTISQHP